MLGYKIYKIFVSILDMEFMHYAIKEWASNKKGASTHWQPYGTCRVLGIE